MDFSGLFSNIDNLFKFLFLGGIVLITLSIVYPLQKKQEIEIEIINFNKDAELLNLEINELNKKVNEFKEDSKSYITLLDSLKTEKNKSHATEKSDNISLRIENIKSDYNKEFSDIEKKKLEIDIKNVITDYNQSKIETLKQHSSSYKSYSIWLLVVGILFVLTGLVGWIYSTINTEALKKQQIKKYKNENKTAANRGS